MSVGAALKMQEKTGISAEFVLNGKPPMRLVDEAVSKIDELQAKQRLLDTNKGIIPHCYMHIRGGRAELALQGESNIVDTVINGISKSFSVRVSDLKFYEKYRDIYCIDHDGYLTVSPEYLDGHIVLAIYRNEFRIFEIAYGTKKMFCRSENCEIPPTDNTNELNILGSIYSIVNYIRTKQ